MGDVSSLQIKCEVAVTETDALLLGGVVLVPCLIEAGLLNLINVLDNVLAIDNTRHQAYLLVSMCPRVLYLVRPAIKFSWVGLFPNDVRALKDCPWECYDIVS